MENMEADTARIDRYFLKLMDAFILHKSYIVKLGRKPCAGRLTQSNIRFYRAIQCLGLILAYSLRLQGGFYTHENDGTSYEGTLSDQGVIRLKVAMIQARH